MRFNSLQFRLTLIIIFGFALLAILVQFVVARKMTDIINQGQDVEYGERLQTVLHSIQRNYDRLQKTGMVATYLEDFQNLTLRQLRQTYTRDARQQVSPFIISSSGQVLLSPRGLEGVTANNSQKILRLCRKQGKSFDLTTQKQGGFWCISQTFEPWGWTIGYLLPLEVKYRVIDQLRQILWFVFSGATLLTVVITVWLVRGQLKPISALTQISAEMARGNLQQRLEIPRNDEVGVLADHFNRMQAAILKTIESLRSSEENLRVTLDSIGDAVIATDTDTCITRMNPVAEKMTGWTADMAIGKPLTTVFRIVDAESHQELEAPAQAVLERDEIVSFGENTLLIAKNGKESLIADSIAPIRNDNHVLLGVVLVFRDITEEKALQEQLLQSRKMDTIGQLAGGIAHDFNNMLGGVIGSAELLKRRLPDDQKAEKFLDMIMESAERAAELTSKLLAFARKQHVSSTPVDVHQALRNALSILGSTVDRRIQISSSLAAEASMVVGDLTQLQNVFLNLAINAAQAMPDGGTLAISTQVIELDKVYCEVSPFDLQPGSYLEIEFRDTGCGIPTDQLDRIFEPFFTTKGRGEGTGLGLAAVLGTVQMHKGAVTVYSEVGAGTVFHVQLPLTEEAAVKHTPAGQLVRGSGLILIVDDEAVMRVTAAAVLEDLGYNVLLAEDGVSGLDLYRQQKDEIDLVLLDMIMPNMNGSDCFAEMQKINPEVKVILSSGFTRNEDLASMRAAGLAGFIRKPYRGVVLSQTVAAALGVDDFAAVLWDK